MKDILPLLLIGTKLKEIFQWLECYYSMFYHHTMLHWKLAIKKKNKKPEVRGHWKYKAHLQQIHKTLSGVYQWNTSCAVNFKGGAQTLVLASSIPFHSS